MVINSIADAVRLRRSGARRGDAALGLRSSRLPHAPTAAWGGARSPTPTSRSRQPATAPRLLTGDQTAGTAKASGTWSVAPSLRSCRPEGLGMRRCLARTPTRRMAVQRSPVDAEMAPARARGQAGRRSPKPRGTRQRPASQRMCPRARRRGGRRAGLADDSCIGGTSGSVSDDEEHGREGALQGRGRTVRRRAPALMQAGGAGGAALSGTEVWHKSGTKAPGRCAQVAGSLPHGRR